MIGTSEKHRLRPCVAAVLRYLNRSRFVRGCVYVCRRIESQLVSNSIGVAQMEWGGEGEAEGPRGAGATGVIAAMRFYWGDGAGGSPSAILHPNIPAHLDSAQSSGAAAAKAGGGGVRLPRYFGRAPA